MLTTLLCNILSYRLNEKLCAIYNEFGYNLKTKQTCVYLVLTPRLSETTSLITNSTYMLYSQMPGKHLIKSIKHDLCYASKRV